MNKPPTITQAARELIVAVRSYPVGQRVDAAIRSLEAAIERTAAKRRELRAISGGRKPLDPATIKAIRKATGSLREIGKQFGLSHTVVAKYRRK